MGIRKWLSKRRANTLKDSRAIRSTAGDSWSASGFPENDPAAFCELREQVYKELFGTPQSVSHELLPLVPHIDVYVYAPGHAGRPFYTLASSGMSDQPMAIEDGVDRSYRRREIILYCEAPDEEYVKLVRFLARFPFQYSTWLGPGHTVPNGDPPAPIFGKSDLVAVLLSETVMQPDRQLADRLVLDGDPVHFLWPIPITIAELEHKLNRGYDALLDLFDQVEHPVVLNRRRACYLS